MFAQLQMAVKREGFHDGAKLAKTKRFRKVSEF
jgi:hypothetical protein